MGRTYVELSCGCLASCDGGGGLIPCSSDDCKFDEWKKNHPLCPVCGLCLTCYSNHLNCLGSKVFKWVYSMVVSTKAKRALKKWFKSHTLEDFEANLCKNGFVLKTDPLGQKKTFTKDGTVITISEEEIL